MEKQKSVLNKDSLKKNKSKTNFLLNILYKLFFAVVIAIVVLLIISKLDLPGNFQVLIVRSGSMEPSIKTGSIVVVKPSDEYNVGDVITFSSGGRNAIPTTHRIMEIKEENGQKVFVTKGDANDSIDLSEVKERHVIGRILFDIPYVGYAIATAQKPIGFIFLIAIPALLIIYDEIIKIFQEIKKMLSKKKKDELIKKNVDEK